MRRTRIVASALAVVGLVGLQASVTSTPVSAHEHPTPVERDSPGVVYVETRGHVEISLIEPDVGASRRIALTQKTYEPVLSRGSGFAVDPSGFIVTSKDTISPDKRPAEIFAVNQLFSERYGAAAPLPENPFAIQQIASGRDGRLNQRLQRCYRPNTTDVSGGCVVRTTLRVTVYPYVTSQELYGTLSARILSRSLPNPDIAVLKIGANSMPTVELASSAEGAEALAVLGFTGIPGRANRLVKVNAHLDQRTGTVKDEDLATLVPALTDGLRGGPVVAENGQVVGFFPWAVAAPGVPASSVTNPPRPELVDAATIQTALATVGVSPKRGPTDLAFEDALHSFKNAEFAGSIPSLQSTLRSYPGHFIATANLEVAQARRGTAADLTGQGGGGTPGSTARDTSDLAWVGAAIAGTAVLVAVALLLVRRHRRGAALPSTERPPAPAAGSAAGSSPAARSSAARPATPAPRAPGEVGTPVPVVGQPQQPAPGRPAHRDPAQGGLSTMPVRLASTPEPRRPAASFADEEQAYCTSCGQRLAPNHRFCGWCGHHIS